MRQRFVEPTLAVARELLGATLVRKNRGQTIRGIIVETEAYCGPKDRASHASRGRTPRSERMFGDPGYAYVYLIYGMHHCFNIVTERAGYPAAVLIRSVLMPPYSLYPTPSTLIAGPGRVCKAFDIDRTLNGWDITRGEKLWIEATPSSLLKKLTPWNIKTSPRIGVDYAGVWAKKPWRFTSVPPLVSPSAIGARSGRR